MSAKKEHYIMASGNKHRSKGDHKHADVDVGLFLGFFAIIKSGDRIEET